MITLLTCNGYRVLETLNLVTLSELPARCREWEERQADGYAVVAMNNGRLIADAEGLTDDNDEGHVYRAQIDRACGYMD